MDAKRDKAADAAADERVMEGESCNGGATAGDRPWADLLIALNQESAVGRPAACRLAACPQEWIGGGAAAAAELGVPPGHLAAARALVPRAARIARRERRRAAALGARIVTRADPDYPPALLDLTLPPPLLYVRGTLPVAPAVAMVGSRRASPYGREAAELLARELAAAGVVVVSGFARGIDATSHRGALAPPGGRTVAVLGCGLGVDYPKGHRPLGDGIASQGAVVTELPVGTEPTRWTFPVRNRIIAALARAVVVVQAAPRSGSLITAHQALELGRDVWAVPGRIFDAGAQGTNALLRDGAYPLLHPRDLLESLGLATAAKAAAGPQQGPAPKGPHRRLLAALDPGDPRPPEALAQQLDRPVEKVLAALLELELAGRVRRHPGPAYTRRA